VKRRSQSLSTGRSFSLKTEGRTTLSSVDFSLVSNTSIMDVLCFFRIGAAFMFVC